MLSKLLHITIKPLVGDLCPTYQVLAKSGCIHNKQSVKCVYLQKEILSLLILLGKFLGSLNECAKVP
jgi:hypothetical protein